MIPTIHTNHVHLFNDSGTVVFSWGDGGEESDKVWIVYSASESAKKRGSYELSVLAADEVHTLADSPRWATRPMARLIWKTLLDTGWRVQV